MRSVLVGQCGVEHILRGLFKEICDSLMKTLKLCVGTPNRVLSSKLPTYYAQQVLFITRST